MKSIHVNRLSKSKVEEFENEVSSARAESTRHLGVSRGLCDCIMDCVDQLPRGWDGGSRVLQEHLRGAGVHLGWAFEVTTMQHGILAIFANRRLAT